MDKKISFGFSKVTKKPQIIPKKPPEAKKVELIDCLEGQSIKIKDAIEEKQDSVLVIPIKDNAKNLLDRVKEARNKPVKKETINERPDSELTIEERAVRELMKDAKNKLSSDNTVKVHTLPIAEEAPNFEGEKEPSLEDYENVPIEDYGLAMLRGMGWKEGNSIGKNPTKITATKNEPELRPKGLGLGANVATSNKTVEKKDKDGNELILKKEAFAKIIAGAHKGHYCQVQGLDDEAGRVIVKTAIKENVLTLNEFVLVPVTKEEYSTYSKVLNNAKYEEYKKKSDKNLEKQRNRAISISSEEEKQPPTSYEENKIGKHEEKEEKSNKSHNRHSSYRRSSSRESDVEHRKKHSKSKHQDRDSDDTDNKGYRRKSRKDKSKYRDRSRSNENYHYKKSKKSKSRNRAQSSASSSSDCEDSSSRNVKKSSNSKSSSRKKHKSKHHKRDKKKC